MVDEIVAGYIGGTETCSATIFAGFHHDHLNSATALTGHNGDID